MNESPKSSDRLSVAARECYPELGDWIFGARHFRCKVLDANGAKSTLKIFLRI